jgi:hypothetical protein
VRRVALNHCTIIYFSLTREILILIVTDRLFLYMRESYPRSRRVEFITDMYTVRGV